MTSKSALALRAFVALAPLACVACDALDPAGAEIDETRAQFPYAMYHPPAPVDRADFEIYRYIALAEDGSYALDEAEISPEELAAGFAEEGALFPPSTFITIAEAAPFSEVLPLFGMMDEAGFEGAWLEEIEAYSQFDGAGPGEMLPADAFFRGSVAEDEFPVFVSYNTETDSCRATFNGQALTGDQLYQSAFQHLDTSVQRAGGVEAVMADPAILASMFTTVQAAPETPWRCVGGATFNLWRAGYPAIRYELVDER